MKKQMNSDTQLILVEKIEHYYDCNGQVTYLDTDQVQKLINNKLPSVKRTKYTTRLVQPDSKVLEHFFADDIPYITSVVIDNFKLDEGYDILMRVCKSNTSEPVFYVLDYDYLDDGIHEIITAHNYNDSVDLMQDGDGCYVCISGEPIWTDSKDSPGYTPRTRIYFEKYIPGNLGFALTWKTVK